MEEQKISPELAYAKSRDFIALGISDIEKSRKKIYSLQISVVIISLAAGAVLWLLTHKILLLAIPVAIGLLAVMPRTAKLLIAFRNAQQKMESDKENLESGKMDPRDYYEARKEFLLSHGRGHVLEELAKDTGGLTAREREMLSGFSEQEGHIKRGSV